MSTAPPSTRATPLAVGELSTPTSSTETERRLLVRETLVYLPDPSAIDPDARYQVPNWTPQQYPNIDHVVIDESEPVANVYCEKQPRLLTEPLFTNWHPGREFVAMADVGVFHDPKAAHRIPDVLLAMEVSQGPLRGKLNLSYFIWHRGKVPDVIIEIVSQYRGGEDTHRKAHYQFLQVPHYVIWDPLGTLSKTPLRYFRYRAGRYIDEAMPDQLDGVGLSLQPWSGKYEDEDETWLRWHLPDGTPIPTGAESTLAERRRADDQSRRADDQSRRADRLAAQLRAAGIDPDAAI